MAHTSDRQPDSAVREYHLGRGFSATLTLADSTCDQPLASFQKLTIRGPANKSDTATVDLAAGGTTTYDNNAAALDTFMKQKPASESVTFRGHAAQRKVRRGSPRGISTSVSRT